MIRNLCAPRALLQVTILAACANFIGREENSPRRRRSWEKNRFMVRQAHHERDGAM